MKCFTLCKINTLSEHFAALLVTPAWHFPKRVQLHVGDKDSLWLRLCLVEVWEVTSLWGLCHFFFRWVVFRHLALSKNKIPCIAVSVKITILVLAQNGGLGKLFLWVQIKLRLLSSYVEFFSKTLTLQTTQTVGQTEFSQAEFTPQIPLIRTPQISPCSLHNIIRDCELTMSWFLAPTAFLLRVPSALWLTDPRATTIPCLSKLIQTTVTAAAAVNESPWAPSSALSALKHLLHVQFSTALNSGKSKPILTGILQDTSLQWGLSVWQIQTCFPQLFWH